jgi:hypothetical protein
MRLINVDTLEMKEFFDHSMPPYAILSHTWGSDEVSFQDWQVVADFPALLEASRPFSEHLGVMDAFTTLQQAKVTAITGRAGYQKILEFCRAVHACSPINWTSERPCWAWVDTCCIDKTSSAELSEAINSMFKWYAQSDMCLVYLPDVPAHSQQDPAHPDLQFRTSRWFSRGWTLQELLAPSVLRFYSQDWNPIGWVFKSPHFRPREAFRRDPGTLIPTLVQVTGIPVDVISGRLSVGEVAVSAKMSWVSKRRTTRIEDMAYCMLGLLGVHMPLLYGEGHQAFTRLQEEIIKVSIDHTIFAWRYGAEIPQPGATKTRFNDLLAQSPSDFVKGNRLSSFTSGLSKDTSFQMTNGGLHIRLSILLLQPPLIDIYCALINCVETLPPDGRDLNRQGALAIPLVASTDTIPSGTLDDDTTLHLVQGGIPMPVSLPSRGTTGYYSVITRRIFIPRSPPKGPDRHHQPPRSAMARPNGRYFTGDMHLHLQSMAYTETPWKVTEVFPPLVRAEYHGTSDLAQQQLAASFIGNPLTVLPSLDSTYIFALRAKVASSNGHLSTLPHYFRLKGDRDLVLAVELGEPPGYGQPSKCRICLYAASQFPHRSLLSEFLNGGLDQFSEGCEWHELAHGRLATKRLHVGGFDYDVSISSDNWPTASQIYPARLPVITLAVTSLSTSPTNSQEPLSSTTSISPQTTPE